MAKTTRGKALWKTPSRGRGTCPICLATRVKCLYTKTKSDGKQVNVCKRCSKATVQRIDGAYVFPRPVPFRRKHRKALNRLKSTAR